VSLCPSALATLCPCDLVTLCPCAFVPLCHTLTSARQFPSYDHALHDPTDNGTTVFPSVRVVIVEGNYLLLWKAKLEIDYHFFLHVELGVAKARLAARHAKVWGWPLERARARVDASDALNMDVVQDSMGAADMVVDDVEW
jgi:pantothenate kinase